MCLQKKLKSIYHIDTCTSMFVYVFTTITTNGTSPDIHQQMIGLFSSMVCICNDIYGKESVNIIPYKCINLDFDINQECQYDIRYSKQLQSSKIKWFYKETTGPERLLSK